MLEQKLDMFGPIEQATRCLNKWLKEENRSLGKPQKQRVAAFMARYFLHEETVSDQLMLSFLRHYSGRGCVDMEDPASVRMEIKALLDQSQSYNPIRKQVLAAGVVVAMVAGAWGLSHRQINKTQQVELKALVHQVATLDQNATHAGIWAEMKAPLRVRSYQDINWWNYRRSRGMLEKRLAILSARM